MVAIADVVADDDDFFALEISDEAGEAGGGEVVALAEAVEFFAFEGVGLGELVDDGGGGVDDFAGGECDAAAAADDDVLLGDEARVCRAFVFASLDVDVGLDGLEEVDGGGCVVDEDAVDAFEGGEGGGAEVVGDEGAGGAFVDVGVGGDGDEQDVSESAGLLEVGDVAWVDDVETAVALDEGFAVGSELVAPGKKSGAGEEFGVGGHDLDIGIKRPER